MSTSDRWTAEDTLNLRTAVGTVEDGVGLLIEDRGRCLERIDVLEQATASLMEQRDKLQARVAELEEGQEPQPDPETPKPTITLDAPGPFELRDAPRVVKATVENAPEGAMVFWHLNGAVVDYDQPHNATYTIFPHDHAVGEHRITALLAESDDGEYIVAPPLDAAEVRFTAVRPDPSIPTVIRTQRDLWGEDSIWTRPLAPDAPIHADSAAMVAELVRQGEAYGRNINASKWTTALNVADAQTRRLALHPTRGNGDWWRKLDPIAWPDGARIDPAGDLHYTVVEIDEGLVKGVWHAVRDGGVLRGEYGGVTRMRGDNGITPANGETASNLPAIGGTILRAEWAKAINLEGLLDHALAMSVPQQWPGHVWPARRTDGRPSVPHGVPEAAQIPMGTHFRLPADWKIPTDGISDEAFALCEALRLYGAYVRDKAGDVVFYAELADEPLMPWAKLQSVLAEIPWGELQVVDHGPRTRRAGL